MSDTGDGRPSHDVETRKARFGNRGYDSEPGNHEDGTRDGHDSETPEDDEELRIGGTGRAGIAVSSLIVMGGFVASKAIGIVRQSIIGRAFGAGEQLDAYYAAFKLPDLLLTLIAGGAVATTFIPLFAGHLAAGNRERAWRLASVVLNVLLAAMSLVALVAALLASWLVRTLIAPGFDAPQQAMTAELLRIVLLSSLLFAASSLVMSVLQAHHRFLLPALADFFYDVGIIGGALLLAPRLGIRGLAWGVVAGAALHLLVQVPGLIRCRARYVPALRTGDHSLRRLLRLMGPRILILGMFQFVLLFTTNLASRLPQGSIAAINVGWIVMQMPEVVFGMAIAIAAFPTLSQLASQGDRARLGETASNVLRAILLTTLPSTVALLLLGRPYVALLFGTATAGGAANAAAAVDAVYGATVAFTAGLLGHSLLELAARLFYAHQDTLTPFWAALGATAVNVTLCLALVGPLGHVGLALANSIAVSLQAGVLLWWGWRSLVRAPWKPLLALAGRAGLAAAGMAAAIVAVLALLPRLLPGAGALPTALVGSLAGGLTYLALLALLSPSDVRALLALARSKFARAE
jgi:putative peptidoglycan lipid II flippase